MLKNELLTFEVTFCSLQFVPVHGKHDLYIRLDIKVLYNQQIYFGITVANLKGM